MATKARKRESKKTSVSKPLGEQGYFNFDSANQFTKWDEIKLQNRLQYVVWNFISHFETHYFPKYIQAYKNYNQINDDRAAELASFDQEWRSNVKTPFIKMRIDALFSSLYTSSFELSAKARKESFVDSQKAYQSYIDRCFSNSENKKAVIDWIKEAIIVGNWFFRIWFKVLKEMIKYKKQWSPKDEVFELDEVAAKMEFVSPFDLFYEEDSLPFYKKRRVIYRRWLPIEEAKEIYWEYINITAAQESKIITKPYKFSVRDYTKYKLLQFYSQFEVDSDKSTDSLKFDLALYDNDYIEVVEYWEPKNFVLAFNWFVVYDWINPYPFNAHPFLQIWFQTTPWYTTGTWLGISQNWLQTSYDILFNAYLDSVKISAAPMFKADKWFFVDWQEQHLGYVPYKILTSRWDNKKFERIDITKPDPNINNALMTITNIWDMDAGTNRYSMGGAGIERSATGATMQQAITKDKLNPLVESINNDLFTKAAEYFSLLWLKYLPNKFKVRITWPDNVNRFETITKDSLMWRFDVYFNVETFKNVAKELEKQQNLEALQIMWQAAIDPVSKRYLLKQENIIKKTANLFDFGPDSILSADDYYQILKEEEIKKLQTQKEIRDVAKEENLYPPQEWFWWQPGQQYNQWWTGGYKQWWDQVAVSWPTTNPETFDKQIEWANERKVDMWDILQKLSW